MKTISAIVLGFAICLLLATAAMAQGGPPAPRLHRYDPAAEVTIKGTVQDVQQYPGRRGWNGVHLVLKTESATIDVHVGPSTYLAQEGFSFTKGDEIEVVGSKIALGKGAALVARKITKDGKVLVLRDAQGFPRWTPRPRA